MSNLEKILKHIEDNANNNAKELIEKANVAAAKTIKEAQAQADLKYAQRLEQAKVEANAHISFAKASSALKKKQIVLDSKQQIIKDLINQAKNHIVSLPESEYFDIILKMVKKYCMGKPGQIIFSELDKKRMPKNFEKLISEAISEKKCASLELSNEVRAVDGGFILNYGDVEQNCSFDALFADKYDLLQDEAYKLLFDENSSSAV
jgi:V/A-type H+-transporting ATPase subunit E